MRKYKVEVICEKKEEIVGRADKARQGWAVFDSRGKWVGTVEEIFGPVSRPYIKIKLSQNPSGKIVIGGDGRWRRRRRRSG